METKVAKIISDTKVVLAAGSNQHISEGAKFVIFEPGTEILDPETNESLGNLEIVKGRVQVQHVMPDMCVARTNVKRETRVRTIDPFGGPNIARLMGALQESYEVEVGEKLKVCEEDIDPRYATPDLTVRVGDRARLVENQ